MIYNYTIDENDYLQYLYYSTSKSAKVQKRRSINKLLLMVMYVGTGMFLFSRNGPIASAAFFLLCVPLYFLYNSFERKQYQRHFTKFINTHFKERIGKPHTIDLEENGIHVVDDEDNRVAYSEIEWIAEISSQIIIQSKAGPAFIIPKNKLDNAEKFMSELAVAATMENVPFNKELEWKWK